MTKLLFKKPSQGQIDTALLVIRVITGVIFLAHGYQKVFGFGFAGVTGVFAGMGVPAPQILAPSQH